MSIPGFYNTGSSRRSYLPCPPRCWGIAPAPTAQPIPREFGHHRLEAQYRGLAAHQMEGPGRPHFPPQYKSPSDCGESGYLGWPRYRFLCSWECSPGSTDVCCRTWRWNTPPRQSPGRTAACTPGKCAVPSVAAPRGCSLRPRQKTPGSRPHPAAPRWAWWPSAAGGTAPRLSSCPRRTAR